MAPSPMIWLPWFALLSFALIVPLPQVAGIECFQCDSNKNLECAELFDESNTALRSQPCEDIHQAQFCIKTTGIFAGQVGTARNCSSRDLGNYCTYLKRMGDDRPTRSCIYTCSSDGCNTSSSLGPSFFVIIALLGLISVLGSSTHKI